MAVQHPDTNATLQSAPGATTTETQQAPGYSTDKNTPRLFAMLNMLGVGQTLGVEIEKYIEAIKASFQKDAGGHSIGQITVRRLAEPTGAHAFISGDAVIILMFDAMLPHDMQNFTPSSDYGSLAFKSLEQEFGKTKKLLHVVLVQPEDYPLALQMANWLQLNLAVATNTANSADSNLSVLNGLQFSIDPSVETARNFIQQNSPHAVQERIDLGFTIYAKTPRQDNNMPRLSIEESRPIAAVGAYVEIWLPENQAYTTGTPKYAATVHITNITALLPIPGILPMCMAIAADQFIQQGRWLQPFMSFQKGKANLGNLSPDPQDPKKLWFAPTPDALYKWVGANMYTRPCLAVDVAEGRCRVPALANYGDYKYSGAVYDQIGAFFGNLPMNRNAPPFTVMAQTFCGQYGDQRAPGHLVDSRDLDYIKLLADGSQDQSARLLLQYSSDPALRARVMSERTSGTFKSLYRTRISIITPDVLTLIASEIKSKVAIDGSSQNNQILYTPWLTDTMASYQNANFGTTAPVSQSGRTYAGMIYNA